MNPSDIGRGAIVIVADNETVKGVIVAVLDDDIFEIQSSNGMISRWNMRQIKGMKFKEVR